MARGQNGVGLKSLIELVLVKKDMFRFAQDVKAGRRMGRGISNRHVVLCKVRLVGIWVKRRQLVDRATSIRSDKLSEYQYRKEYARSLEGKRV